jgi:hypothetical protein
VGAPEGAQAGTKRRSYPFGGVAMDLTSAIIPSPFVGTVAHSGVGGMAAVIALPFICVQHCAAGWDILRNQAPVTYAYEHDNSINMPRIGG